MSHEYKQSKYPLLIKKKTKNLQMTVRYIIRELDVNCVCFRSFDSVILYVKRLGLFSVTIQ